MTELETPSNELLHKYIDKFSKDKRYFSADKAIIKLFEAFPLNTELEDILLKISVINDLYSTNIYGTFTMAEHILKLNIDNALAIADPTIVNKIAIGHGISKPKGLGDRNFYSFATKYCSWHNPDSFPIYDRFVEKVLIAYNKKDQFEKFNVSDLKDYCLFKRIMLAFIAYYKITGYGLKELDKFLWIYGKEKFPLNYEKNK